MIPVTFPPYALNTHRYKKMTYHSHLGKIDKVVLCIVGRPLLNKGQVSEIHSQIWHTGRVTTKKNTRNIILDIIITKIK